MLAKNYFDYTYIDYLRFITSQPTILKHISKQENHNFKQPMPAIETRPGAMSIGFDSELELSI